MKFEFTKQEKRKFLKFIRFIADNQIMVANPDGPDSVPEAWLSEVIHDGYPIEDIVEAIGRVMDGPLQRVRLADYPYRADETAYCTICPPGGCRGCRRRQGEHGLPKVRGVGDHYVRLRCGECAGCRLVSADERTGE